MPIVFKNGGDLTLRQSLKYTDRGSRSPHPGGGNNMTTILMQLGVPTVFFWEVTAGLSGYEVTHLGGQKISLDFDKCGPWAQFEPRLWDGVLNTLPAHIANLVETCQTPYQAHMTLTKTAFPIVAESSATFYLREKDLVEKILLTIADSRFAGHFSKRVYPNGKIVTSTNAYKEAVLYEDGSQITVDDLAKGYLNTLEVVAGCDQDNRLNPLNLGVGGTLPDARIMSVLDMAIFASRENTDTVYAWSGVAMFQYILGSADSQRWREVTSDMYDLVRERELKDLPKTLNFVLIPTQGLGQLVVTESVKALELNSIISSTKIPAELSAASLSEKFRNAVVGLNENEVLSYLLANSPTISVPRLQKMLKDGNIAGACGIAAHVRSQTWLDENRDAILKARNDLAKALLDEQGDFILQKQPTITPLEILLGQQLFLLDGVLDTPTSKLEALRAKYQDLALKRCKPKSNGLSTNPYSHAGWDW